MNRIIPERRSDWFVHILSKEYFKKSKNILAGILEESTYNQMQESILKNALDNLSVLKFISDPSQKYKKAKFFVLPADIIFANNSLLEAMSYGVVPLVAKQPGTEMIVEDGVNGFVFDYNEESFERAMRKAMETPDEIYISMSLAAQNQIRTHFSFDGYLGNLSKLYNQFNI
ncbi:MAG: glycosyltransferase [Bacteroidetes bacterium]|nr:glycosyltransferase [Bacteroidota bacterium]